MRDQLLNVSAILILMLACVCLSTNHALAATYTVDSIEDFEDLNLSAGDEVIWENGTYNDDERLVFNANGTASNPITLRAESPGGVIFTGGLKMDIAGNYLIVEDFHWKGGYGASNFIQFRNGTNYAQNSIIRNCVIDDLGVEPGDAEEAEDDGAIVKHRWIVLYGTNNSVLNCSFLNKTTAGALVLVELEYNAEDDRCDVVGHEISNNYFYKYEKMDPSLSNSGDSETIRVGTSEYQNVDCRTIVSNNYFVESDGENEIITNKSDNNIYSGNTFRRCRGSLTLRHGSGATVKNNFFLGENVDGTGGIRIVDSDHTITNNYIQDCITVVDQAKWNNGITFMGGGDNSQDNCNSTSVSNGYQESENITVSNNTLVNTNAPLFFNGDKGTNDNTGNVNNNVIYYQNGNDNITNVISEDDNGDFDDIGGSLSFSGNVYDNTSLGESTNGFSSANLSSSNNGEILNISGTNAGANISGSPYKSSDVSDSVGACFVNSTGNATSSGDCSGNNNGNDDNDNEDECTSASVPSSRTVTNVTTSSASVNWTYDSKYNYYNVRYRATDDSDWTKLTFLRLSEGDFTVSGSLARKTISGLSSDTEYEWQVRAKCDDTSISTGYSDGAGPDFTTSSDGGGGTSGFFIPDPNKIYYIENHEWDKRLAADGSSNDAYAASSSTTGADVEWKFVAKGNGSWHVQLADGGNLPRIRTNESTDADMQATSSSGAWTYYDFAESTTNGTYYMTLPDGPSSYQRLRMESNEDITFVPTSNTGTWVSWRFVEAGSSTGGERVVHIRKRNALSYAIDGSGQGSNGQNVYLWSQNSNNENQQWIEIDRGGGNYSYQKEGTNYCLDAGNGGANNQNVYLWTCSSTNQNQQWQHIDTGNGYVKLKKRNANYAINGGNGGTNNQNINLWSSSSNNYNLQWRIDGVSAERLGLDEEFTSELKILPNPTSGMIYVKGVEAGTEMHILNISGQIIIKTTNQSIDVSSLKPGIYVLRTIYGKYQKFIKI